MSRVQKAALIAHPDTAAQQFHLGAEITLVGSDVVKIEYVAIGLIETVLIPDAELPSRKDELWRHTCFEAFFSLEHGYVEFNFAPSRHYAVYRFEEYRGGMQPALDWPAPDIYVERNEERYSLTAWIDLKPLGRLGPVGLSAVIEAKDGIKSYWALAHAPGPPDFHNPDCFIATLPAPDRA